MALSLEDHFSIQQLNIRYARTIDAGDAVGWATCFVPRGVFATPDGVEVIGRRDLIELARRTAAASDAGLRRHWVGAIHAEARVGGGAGAECYGLVVGGGEAPSILAAITYEDELERVEGQWLFRRRAVHLVG